MLFRSRVNATASAVHDASQTKKNLFAGTSLRKDIEKFAARVRLYHNQHTLPWADKGERMLPTALFMEYKQTMNGFEQTFNMMCNNFFVEYPRLVAEAPANLGSMYKAEDYPDLTDVRLKFGFKRTVKPVPEAGDFRIDVGNNELVELRAQYDSAYEDRVAEAMKTTWDKLHGVLTGVSEKLTEPEGDKAKIFHGTFLTNITELCGLLTHLNITKDPKLEEARMQLERAVNAVTLDDVKEDPLAHHYVMSYLDFLTPGSLYLGKADSDERELLKSNPVFFDSQGMRTEQRFATSKDGTQVPYFVVYPKNIKSDGTNPTV